LEQSADFADGMITVKRYKKLPQISFETASFAFLMHGNFSISDKSV
jgi:hypothetical protein